MGKGKTKSRWKLRLAWRGFILLAILALAAPGIVRVVPPEVLPANIRPFYRQLGRLVERVVDEARIEPQVEAAAPARTEGSITAYFAPGEEIERALCHLIDNSRNRLAVCVFDLDLESVVAALERAFDRGVQVRVITDSDNLNLPELGPLKEKLIPIKGDSREPYMHHKFVVADDHMVWLGSINFTRNGFRLNDNNALCIEAPELAANYLTEFEEMWQQDAFGPSSPVNTPYPRIQIGDTLVENYFSPDDGVIDHLLRLVGGARERIDVMAFSFTSPDLAAALEERMAAGVQVRCLFDAAQAGNSYSRDEALAGAGAAVRRRGHRGVMHHKVIVIDGRTVITGSYNFSKNAENRNDENVLVVHSPAIAAAYAVEFDRCWGGAE